ncbi:MAG: DUF4132 domain-containing protein [Phycisphaerales bacterium]|nr:DUF4132 domain-containing protein [Phycisphaerales bacterium]
MSTFFINAWTPTPFRAPGKPALVAEHREEWFDGVVGELSGYDPDPQWLAMWGGHIGYDGINESTRVLSAAIDMGGPVGAEVQEILRQSATNSHEIGVMGRHVTDALMQSASPAAWDVVVKMLLSAQREEGLRQSILEPATGFHPGAFKRLLSVIIDENLVRFASTVRAADVWFGLRWDSVSSGTVVDAITAVLELIEDPKARASAIAGKDHQRCYLALWCEAAADVDVALSNAKKLLTHATPEKRWIALHMLDAIAMPESLGDIASALDDSQFGVAARAVQALKSVHSRHQAWIGNLAEFKAKKVLVPADTFDRLHRLMERVSGKEQKFKPLVFPWSDTTITAASIGEAMLDVATSAHAEQVARLIGRFSANGRSNAAHLIAGHKDCYAIDDDANRALKPKLSALGRATLINLLGDPAEHVRRVAAYWLGKEPMTDEEATKQEELLTRAADDVRARALERLQTRPDDFVLAVATRFIARGKSQLKPALELLRVLITAGRSVEAVLALATQVREKHPKPTADVRVALEAIFAAGTGDASNAPKVDDAFGLAPIEAEPPVPTVRKIAPMEITRATIACIASLVELIDANKLFEVKERDNDGNPDSKEGVLLSHDNAIWRLRPPSGAASREMCPVGELLFPWLENRAANTRDADGLELMRAWVISQARVYERGDDQWPQAVRKLIGKGGKGSPRYVEQAEHFLAWALKFSDGEGADFLLDQLEGAIERSHLTEFDEYGSEKDVDLDAGGPTALKWLEMFREFPHHPSIRRPEARLRLSSLLLSAKSKLAAMPGAEAAKKSRRSVRPWERTREFDLSTDEVMSLWHQGAITDGALLRYLCFGAVQDDGTRSCDALRHVLGSWKWRPIKDRAKQDDPRLDVLLEPLRRRIVEIELARGDADTVATPHAFELDPSGGADVAVPALASLGKISLVRQNMWRAKGRAASLSQLIRNSCPTTSDTPESFAKAARAAGLSDQRLVELALYQPRWVEFVQHTLGWDGLTEGVLWLRLHTREAREDYAYDIAEEREAWESKAYELTPISPESLADGAVDRSWLRRCHAKLGPKRWAMLYDAAKYASSGIGHSRARLFADAILGEVSERELLTRITTKRNQDSARALGLLEIKDGDAGRKQVLKRFSVLQEMRRTSRKHGGSMLQASEKRAIEVGMENLAWSAGYPDPLRLQWAMEIEELGDLAKGPVIVSVETTEVTLSIDDQGVPSLTATKAGKPLKSIPPAVKKHKRVVPLAEQLTTLRRQGSRIRHALEQAMCRGDEFGGGELTTLFGHPILRTMLQRIVLVGTTKAGGALLGYPDKGGKALRSHDGSFEPLRASDSVRIAHPLDLLKTKQWDKWQRECFAAERVQPFKQIFREVYVPTSAELSGVGVERDKSVNRYGGQQVQPRQALALFGSRGWVARPEEGVQRTFHRESITVHVGFLEGFYTPAEIDGLTLDGLWFSRVRGYEPLKPADIPARVFSEVLRDLDLVVSVAHRGGVDPEASQSTIEIRTALLRETCQLLSINNVSFEKSRAIIAGELAHYSLHLGSGSIHKLPGGAVWVIPVHSQHRGRIFLPFADDDPRTAEIISKALLLARDREIRDPSILSQIRS